MSVLDYRRFLVVNGKPFLELFDPYNKEQYVQLPATDEALVAYVNGLNTEVAKIVEFMWERTVNDIRRSAENNRATVDPIGVDVYEVGPVVAKGGMHEDGRTGSNQFDGGSTTPHVGVVDCHNGTCACDGADEQREGKVPTNDGA